MKDNVAVSLGSVALIDKVDDELGFFNRVFGNLYGKVKDFIPYTKLFMYNKLEKSFALKNILTGYSSELFSLLKFLQDPKERSLYRNLGRIGKAYQVILGRFQGMVVDEKLVTDTNFMDFSSSYFEGSGGSLGATGYSRDNQPGKKQLTFGVCTGINGIPCALTIQKGNVQDKEHSKFMIKVCGSILEEGSLLIFDTGGNTKKNKEAIRTKKLHYLTLKPKKVGPYKAAIAYYNTNTKEEVIINKTTYLCVKQVKGEEVHYIFFSEKFKQDQLVLKERKFRRELEKNKGILKKTKAGKGLGEFLTEEGIVITTGSLQKMLLEIENPRINGLEGFFILECSLNVEPMKVLALYKDKDKAEKLFRSIKEGTEMRPIRHWSTNAIIGYILVIFLSNFLVNLTLLRARDPDVKNTKLLKKYLDKLTLVTIYPPSGFKFKVLANICPEITSILGDFIERYRDKTLPMRW